MFEVFKKDTLGKADYGWLKPRYHFSFSSYYNPNKRGFGSLRVLNDDLIKSKGGFDTHPHKNMEIITYVIDGELTHQDSMGNKRTLSRGQVQYMSAGTGVFHSEYNNGDTDLRLLQIWILPDKTDVTPNYGDKLYELKDRLNKQYIIVSNGKCETDIKIEQDAEITIGEYQNDTNIDISIEDYNYIYYVQIEGNAVVEGNKLDLGDAFVSNQDVSIQLKTGAHFLYIKTKDM